MNNTLRDSIPTIKVPLALLLVMGLVTSVVIVLNQSDGWILFISAGSLYHNIGGFYTFV